MTHWLSLDLLLAVHDAQIAEHGGAEGVRELGLLESALARPLNLAAYGKPDFAALAAALGFGIARNHPFVDGNKRTAYVAVETFMVLNGQLITATDSECVMTFLALAGGELPEDALAAWLRAHSTSVGG